MKKFADLNYLRIEEFNVANGPGVRVVVWFSGCPHHCKECHNPESWDENIGKPFTEREVKYIDKLLENPYVKGLTLSGGDPIYVSNNIIMEPFLKYIKKNHPGKTIWCYTGYTYEHIKTLSLLNYIDVLVDGKFEVENRDITLPFRGSSNQRIIDITHSKIENKTVLWEPSA